MTTRFSPWPSPEPQNTPSFDPEDGFEFERFLLDRVGLIEMDGNRRTLTEAHTRELFAPVLYTDAVDRAADEATWVRSILGSTADFFAITQRGVFINLVPDEQPAALLVAAGVVAVEGAALLGFVGWFLLRRSSEEPSNRGVFHGATAYIALMRLLVLVVAVAL
jgi:hypothetical protein